MKIHNPVSRGRGDVGGLPSGRAARFGICRNVALMISHEDMPNKQNRP